MLTDWRAFGIEHFNYRLEGGLWSQPEPPPVSRHERDGARIAASPSFENLVDITLAQYQNISAITGAAGPAISVVRDQIEARLAAL